MHIQLFVPAFDIDADNLFLQKAITTYTTLNILRLELIYLR
jgi:hypothetical protein